MAISVPYEQLCLKMRNCLYLDLWNGWSDGEPVRSWNELWLVLGGGARVEIGDREYRVQKGDFCLLPDVLPKFHTCDLAPHFELYVIRFDSSLLNGSLFEQVQCDTWVTQLSPPLFEEARVLFERLKIGNVYQISLNRTLQINRDLYTLMELFFSRVTVTETQRNDSLSTTLQYMATHINEKLSIELLAKRAAMHPKHFSRSFREKMGVSPGRYLAKLRLKQAIDLLLKDKPLQEIADSIGFQNVQQFFRFFKNQTGMTPREYQKKVYKGGNV